MNRHFFADDDATAFKNRVFEVEMIRETLKAKFGTNTNN